MLHVDNVPTQIPDLLVLRLLAKTATSSVTAIE